MDCSVSQIEDLQARLLYRFQNAGLLQLALTHPSVAHERSTPVQTNQRLEFLGDAVLQLAVSAYLIRRHPDLTEGALSKRRSALVRAESLATAAENLKVGRHLTLGRGEEQSGGRTKPSILAGALEAVLGALFLDGGYDQAARVIEAWLERFLGNGAESELFGADFKSRLQEVCQSRWHVSPEYILIGQAGPDHRKEFEVAVRFDGEYRGFGKGFSKKEAEQNAARDMLLGLDARGATNDGRKA
jgi:ribonuclease-3